ncbi:hypothetical protein EV191_101699 [Tamaricihabitans halophyticus]|uniref:Uncharacterized protein n=1 Tax=Tamaricihabitans halophyticus TaxID=1262583 RepID=A0A4R2R2I5_9PSEU|nr:hypothetical protein [Tamaricihabitans halophyticus]TCP56753.1 hypothetical protein EV191_101699 [Tamaricihabitans halophyticus]
MTTIALLCLVTGGQLVAFGRFIRLPRTLEPLLLGTEPRLLRDLLRGGVVLREISDANATRTLQRIEELHGKTPATS